ncbi:MAG: hypothetical protein H7326_11615, partial [Bdellovibrionaceae bacterium]|nr:hypothetical protein [Pseudobdellovibrionaceae bacterium]
MELAIVMGVFFLVMTMIFVFIALFLPEWVGISGKKAKDIMREQTEGEIEAANAAVPAPSTEANR